MGPLISSARSPNDDVEPQWMLVAMIVDPIVVAHARYTYVYICYFRRLYSFPSMDPRRLINENGTYELVDGADASYQHLRVFNALTAQLTGK